MLGRTFIKRLFFLVLQESNLPFVGRIADVLEDTTKSALDRAAPVVEFLEGPVNIADTLCCKALDAIESAVPAVHMEPQEVRTILFEFTFMCRCVNRC